VEKYLACCNDICHSVPQDFNELSLKIIEVLLLSDKTQSRQNRYAAHAALLCLVTCKFSQQPESVQLAILKRHNELS
jgi:hypothetical protein